MSSKRLFSDRLNKLSNKRFSVSEWPSRFSSFGGKRYPMIEKQNMGGKRIQTSNIEAEFPYNQNFAAESSKKGNQFKNQIEIQLLLQLNFEMLTMPSLINALMNGWIK